jgi:hypothetical protein
VLGGRLAVITPVLLQQGVYSNGAVQCWVTISFVIGLPIILQSLDSIGKSAANSSILWYSDQAVNDYSSIWCYYIGLTY